MRSATQQQANSTAREHLYLYNREYHEHAKESQHAFTAYSSVVQSIIRRSLRAWRTPPLRLLTVRRKLLVPHQHHCPPHQQAMHGKIQPPIPRIPICPGCIRRKAVRGIQERGLDIPQTSPLCSLYRAPRRKQVKASDRAIAGPNNEHAAYSY